jgi:hypothetical protein
MMQICLENGYTIKMLLILIDTWPVVYMRHYSKTPPLLSTGTGYKIIFYQLVKRFILSKLRVKEL